MPEIVFLVYSFLFLVFR